MPRPGRPGSSRVSRGRDTPVPPGVRAVGKLPEGAAGRRSVPLEAGDILLIPRAIETGEREDLAQAYAEVARASGLATRRDVTERWRDG